MKKGKAFGRFMSLSIGLRPCIIEFLFNAYSVWTVVCGIKRRVKIELAQANRRYTGRFEYYVPDLCKHMTINNVAHHLGISWHTVKDIQKRHLLRTWETGEIG